VQKIKNEFLLKSLIYAGIIGLASGILSITDPENFPYLLFLTSMVVIIGASILMWLSSDTGGNGPYGYYGFARVQNVYLASEDYATRLNEDMKRGGAPVAADEPLPRIYAVLLGALWCILISIVLLSWIG
jgi:hypothetical protein